MTARVRGYTTRGGKRVGGYVRSGGVVRHSLSMNVVMHSVGKGRSRRYSGVPHARKPRPSGRVPRVATTFNMKPQRRSGPGLVYTHDVFGRPLNPPIPFGSTRRGR